MILKTFRERLESYMSDADMRPFACKGDPYKCRIFLVGTNPATKMHKPFFGTYWDDSKGFLYDKFYRDYDAHRTRKGPTRSCIEKFVCGASPILCLETNIYATPGKALPKNKNDPSIFNFLLREIKPDAIFLFRQPAIDYFEFRFNCELYSDKFVTVDVFGRETPVRRFRPSGGQGFNSIPHTEIFATGKKFKELLSQKRR